MVRFLWAASPIASSTTSAGASCAVSAIILILVVHGYSLVADTTLTASDVFIADVATRIRIRALIGGVPRLREILIWRQIALMWVIVRILPVLLQGLTSAVPAFLLLRVLMRVTSILNRHLSYLRFLHLARFLVLSVLRNPTHAFSLINFCARRYYELTSDVRTTHMTRWR